MTQKIMRHLRSLVRSATTTAAAVIASSAICADSASAQQCPDASGTASSLNLNAGQLAATSRDFAARYAAGELSSSTCPEIIRRGYFFRQPSLTLSVSGSYPGGLLSLNLLIRGEGYCDLVVLVYAPDGRWYEDDDSGEGLEALVQVPAGFDGTYRVWLGHYRAGETCEGTLRLGYGTVATPTAPHGPSGPSGPVATSFAPWWPVTSNPGQFIAQPGGVSPLPVNPGPFFQAGAYDVYLADALNNGMGPYRHVRRYTVTLESNRRYALDIGGTTTGLGLTYASNMYPDPGVGYASLYGNNTNRQTWRAICVLPAGTDFTQCGSGGHTVYSEWSSYTRDQRQFSTQPGGLNPLRTCDRSTRQYASDFPEGVYDVYVGDASGTGFPPYTHVRRFTVTLDSSHNYAVDLGCSTGFCIARDGAQLVMYPRPNEGYVSHPGR